jgi:hypothetical protein
MLNNRLEYNLFYSIGYRILAQIRIEYVQLLGKILEGRLLALVHHDFHHLFADNLLLRALSITGCLHLFTCSLCESNTEDSEHVSIRSLGLNKGFNDIVPFLEQCAELVFSDIHSVEVGVAVVTLHFLNLNLHLSPGISTALILQVSQGNFEDSASQTVSSDLYKRETD